MEVDDYILKSKLGRGSFGEVYLTEKKGSKQLFATKRILKELAMDDSLKRYFNNEIYILKHISHPYIIKLYEIKTTLQYFYLIFENCNGGGLSNCLKSYQDKYNQPFSQEIVQYLMRQIVSGVKYLHNSRILHRDLKLDNILVCFQNDKDKADLNMLNCTLKIIDFGFARYLSSGKLAQSVLGSPINMDPQILAKMKKINNEQTFGYDEKADIWSLGTITYELLIGCSPFVGSDTAKIMEKITDGNYNIPNNLKLSKESISFINAQLQYDPKERLDINSLSTHEFLHKPWQRFTEIDLSKLPTEVNNSQEIIMNINNHNNIWFLFQGTKNLGEIDSRMIDSNQNNMNNNNNQFNHMPVSGLKDQQEDYVGNLIQPRTQQFQQYQQYPQYSQRQGGYYQPQSPRQQYPMQIQYPTQHQPQFPFQAQPQSPIQQPQYPNNQHQYPNQQQMYPSSPRQMQPQLPMNQPQLPMNQPQLLMNQPQSPINQPQIMYPPQQQQPQYPIQPQPQSQPLQQPMQTMQQQQQQDPFQQPQYPPQQPQPQQYPNQNQMPIAANPLIFNPNQNMNIQNGVPSQDDLSQETKQMLMDAFNFLNYDEISLEPLLCPILPKTNDKLLNLN